jgi:hypothetical protein
MAVNLAGGFRVPKRAPFKKQITMNGVDMTGGTLIAQVRLMPEAGGSPLLDLAMVTTAGQQGFRFISADTSGAVPVSRFEMCIDKASLVGLPLAAEPDDDACFAIDFHPTPSGGLQRSSNTAPFIVAPGVTI